MFYYSAAGKKFASQVEVDKYFAGLGFAVEENVFDFAVTEEDREDMLKGDCGSDDDEDEEGRHDQEMRESTSLNG